MSAIWLLQWWNLVFIVPFGLALLYLGIYVFTGIGADHDADAHLEADADADAHVEVDADAHAEIDADGHVEVDADADGDVDGQTELAPAGDHDLAGEHDASGESESDNGFADVLIWLGVGKAPLSLVLMVLAMLWGMVGFFTNRILANASAPEWLIPLVSLPVAGMLSLLGTRAFSRTVARLVPMTETTARKTHDLVGNVGEILSTTDEKFGLVQVRARSGDLFQMPCRVPEGRPVIEKGSKVLLVDYDQKERCFYVVPDELGNALKR